VRGYQQKSMESCDKDKRRICIRKREDVSVVERRKRKDT